MRIPQCFIKFFIMNKNVGNGFIHSEIIKIYKGGKKYGF